jgi:ribonuclease HI
MGKKIYVVARGRRPGVYSDWAGKGQAQEQVRGHAGAVYKSFGDAASARAWLRDVAGHSREVMTALERMGGTPPARMRTEETPNPDPVPAGATVIYTDGGCLGNPGPGGYGCVVLAGGERKELSEGYRLTTNNRMELMACIAALEALEGPSEVVLYSDSRYVVQGITKGWAKGWRRKGWMRTPTEPAKNPDLWERLLGLCDLHRVTFRWVKGHAGTAENERCDALAMAAAQKPDASPDRGYEP